MNAKKIDFYNILLLAIMTVLLLVFFTYLVLIGNNERSAKKTGEVMLNQMCGVLAENQSAEETLLESLKEEYIIRAKTVAYILGHHPEAEYDIEELCKIAQLMSIDEIHLFDETGIIYAEHARNIMDTALTRENRSTISNRCSRISPFRCVRMLHQIPRKEKA